MPQTAARQRAQAANANGAARKRKADKASVEAIRKWVDSEMKKLKSGQLEVTSWQEAKAMMQTEREAYSTAREKLQFALDAGHLIDMEEIRRREAAWAATTKRVLDCIPDVFADEAPAVDRMEWKKQGERVKNIIMNKIADALSDG